VTRSGATKGGGWERHEADADVRGWADCRLACAVAEAGTGQDWIKRENRGGP
jgi:hypothetical protein